MEGTKIIYLRRKVIAAAACALAAAMMFWVVNNPAVVGASAATRQLPIYCVQRDQKLVSISFDAAWGNEDTPKLLEILKQNDVRATFFMTGGWIEKYPDDVKAIAAGGHDLGNHSENHKQMSQLSAEQCKDEIMKPHEKVKQLTGKDMCLFRPPYGDYNDNLINVCRQIGYYPIQWDVEPYDIAGSLAN